MNTHVINNMCNDNVKKDIKFRKCIGKYFIIFSTKAKGEN